MLGYIGTDVSLAFRMYNSVFVKVLTFLVKRRACFCIINFAPLYARFEGAYAIGVLTGRQLVTALLSIARVAFASLS